VNRLCWLILLLAPAIATAADRPLWPAREFPKLGSERRMVGTLVSADFVHRSGTFRERDGGGLVDFRLAPYGSIRFHGAESELRDVPLGTECEFAFVPAFRRAGESVALVECHGTFDEAATQQQRERYAESIKLRGLPAWLDRTSGNELTLTFFSGDAKRFEADWLGSFAVGKDLAVCVANDELRTWNPPTDKEKASLLEIRRSPVDRFGTSGVTLVVRVSYMLEGFRRGKIVRVFASDWKLKDQPYGESLMGYGYARLLDSELPECPAYEYPEQFPFRTDYGNDHLAWYRPQPSQPLPAFSEHLVLGELVTVDGAKRTGTFRADRTGESVEFSLLPEAKIRSRNTDARLEDLPVGVRCRFQMYQDANGRFTLVGRVSDEFSYLAENAVTWRVEELRLGERKLRVARQIPEVKNYNGDMEQPADIGRTELLVSDRTRVFKGTQQASLGELKIGDALVVESSGELPGQPARLTDIWIGTEAQKLATEQAKTLAQAKATSERTSSTAKRAKP